MSETKSEEEIPVVKKKGKLKPLLLGTVLIVLFGGGGAAGGFYAAGIIGGGSEQAEDPNKPKIVLKDGTAVSDKEAGKAAPKQSSSAFKVTYHQIEQPFTSNLSNSDSFAQLSIAVSTYYDERVFENVVNHEIAIRSAVLMELGQQDAFELEAPEGKLKLKKRLREIINQTLEEKTGFGGIEDVYFTNMVVQ
ncbi:flagellar basal body-associated FliL family protein [Parasphingorhabdus halotolerans]|uniref:Flagellar protein FliL n=1 Tax=Parasphingorhabdus halotolerans TaxID=2725558 RepID=A0A6H2DJ59_9SPHN|nr:flagellar basal body-associated FliL family protein [Parasphingorhabdus halotolerans]QJB68023.1 flagellar basal body-associated FliL family protein [Parasphingorhabdus halotolerans]